MMKKLRRLFLVALLYVSSCINSTELNTNANGQDNITLTEFIIGRWEGKEQVSDANGDYYKNYAVDFINNSKLNFIVKSPYDGFSDEFEYRFINDNTLIVENARAKGGEWSVHENGGNLILCIWSNENCLEFTRSNPWKIWLYITASVALVAAFGIRRFRRKKISYKNDTPQQKNEI